MKKTILLTAALGFLIASCAKDRTCTCTDSRTNSSTTTTYTRTVVKSTKGQAKANCVGTKVTDDKGTVYTTECKLN